MLSGLSRIFRKPFANVHISRKVAFAHVWQIYACGPRSCKTFHGFLHGVHVTRISYDSHFAWQAQYSVMLKCHFSWQAQYSVKFGMIAGARNVVFFNTKCSWWSWKVTSVARRVADDGFQPGSFSDPARIMLGSAPHWKWRFSCFREISLKCWRVILRGRRSIRWCSRMTPVVPRIGNNVSHVTRISYDSHFAWLAQYSVMLKCHFSWQAQYSVKFGMIAGARNVVFFNTKCSWWSWKVTSVARRVADDGFQLGSFSDPARIMLGSAPHWKWRFSCFREISLKCWRIILRGRRSIWWCWRMPPVVNSAHCK